MNYKKAIQSIVENRSKRISDAKLLYLELLRTNSELYEIEKAIRNITMDEVFGKHIDKAKYSELIAIRDEILVKQGITHEMLNPPYECEKCKDTGLIEGKPCSCVISKCASDGMIDDGANFEQNDINVFPKEEQIRISKVYDTAKSFCDKFPLTSKLNLILFGRCGSGKTYLASCIANEITAKGYSVIMLSAFALVNRMHKYHTTFDYERSSFLDPLLDCDLLIIDDLGTETMMKNITVEYLFHIINERMTANKHTIVTTNLDDEMIRTRYGDRTYSRLFGNKLSTGFALSNSDLRK